LEPLTIVAALAALTTICTGLAKVVHGLNEQWGSRRQEIRWLGRINAHLLNSLIAAGLILLGVALVGALLLLTGKSSDRAASIALGEQIAFTVRDAQTREQVVAGDCVLQDQTWRGHTEGQVSGDLTGRFNMDWEGTLERSQACQEGVIRANWAIIDSQGSTLYGYAEGGGSLLGLSEPRSASLGGANALVVKSGTGAYDGFNGTGSCTNLVSSSELQPDGSVIAISKGDCVLRMSAKKSLLVAVAANPAEVTDAGGSSNFTNRTRLSVVFSNASEASQSNLQLRLQQPAEASVTVAAKGEAPGEPGARAWALPDLSPAEQTSFQITVSLIRAESKVVPLVLEIRKRGKPAAESEPVLLRVR
jgi:hypothetical protein